MDVTQYDEKGLTDYKRNIREDASGTIRNLRSVLERDPHNAVEDQNIQSRVDINVTNGVEHSDYTYGSAAHRLRNMLMTAPPVQQSAQKTVLFSLPRREAIVPDTLTPAPRPQTSMNDYQVSNGCMLRPEEFLHLLQTQSSRIQQLHLHNTHLTNDLEKIKWRMLEVVEENRALHEELKRSVVDEIMHTGVGVVPPSSTPVSLLINASNSHQPLTRFDHEKWRIELERLNTLHEAKTARLEAQLQFAKEECDKYEKQTTQLESKVRNLEVTLQSGVDLTLVGPVGGLCMQCSQNEALLPATLSHKHAVDSVTRDRDELASQVSVLKVRVEELKHREHDAYQQVKSSIEMVEQSQLDMAQAFIEREQLREELENMRGRFEEHVGQMQKTISEECDLARREGQGVRDQLESRVKELLQQLAEVQVSFERCNRDKMSLAAELEVAQSQLDAIDVDYSKATDNMKVGAAQANVERNHAVQQMMRLKLELDQADRDRHAERSRLKEELEDLRRRLHRAEKEVLEAKEESIQLHTTNQALDKELHLTRMAKESLECTFSDNVNAAEKRAELRESELNALVDSLQTKNARSTAELEEIIRRQESLVQKLREECRNLMQQLEAVSHKYKAENGRLKTSNEHMKGKLDQLTRQCNELSNRLTQQGRLQEKMRERLHDMDGEIQLTSQQKLDLLAKESLLLRDRQQLAQQVEFLQRHLVTSAGDDPVRGKVNVYLGSKLAVDDVLTEVYKELKQHEVQRMTKHRSPPDNDRNVEQDDDRLDDETE